MIQSKKVLGILLSLLLLTGSNFYVSSVYAEETRPKEQIEKYMGLLRYVSYSKNGDPSKLYGYVSDTEEKIEVGKEVSFTSFFPASSLKGKAKEYELVSVEPYVSNFHFGASIYDDQVFDENHANEYFPVYPKYLKDKLTYQKNYVNYSVLNLRIRNPKLTEKGIIAEMSGVLEGNGIPYVTEVKSYGSRYIDNHLYALVGGKSNADAVYRSALERLRGKSKEQLDKEGGYIWFIPYVITLRKKTEEQDLSVVSIDVEKEYPPNTEISVPVKVKSSGSSEVLTSVNFRYKNKRKPIKLRGEDYVVFDFKTPSSGCVTLTAEINKDKSVKEHNYSNNKKSVKICVKPEKEEIPTPGGCPDRVEWEEKDWRWEDIPYESCYVNEKGEEKCVTKFKKEKVWYPFIYEAKLKSKLTLKDREGGQVNNVTIKSGYGFMVSVSSRVEFKQVSGAWKRPPKQKPKNATTAIILTSFSPNTKLIGSSGSFTTPPNPSSKTKAKVIYTPVKLKDGSYSITAQVSGAIAGGKEMCNTLTQTLKIKGNMHEDSMVRPTDNDRSFNSGSSKSFP